MKTLFSGKNLVAFLFGLLGTVVVTFTLTETGLLVNFTDSTAPVTSGSEAVPTTDTAPVTSNF